MSTRWHLTPEIHEALVSQVRQGASYETASAHARVPHTTVHNWLHRGRNGDPTYESLAIDLAQARAQVEMRLLSYVMQSAEMGQWQAATWLLERVWPERYGKRAAEQAAASEGLQVVVRVSDASGRAAVDADSSAE